MDVYRQYRIACFVANMKVLSTVVFFDEMTNQKICIYKPKKDQCDLCIGQTLGYITEEMYIEHTQKKEEARIEKNKK